MPKFSTMDLETHSLGGSFGFSATRPDRLGASEYTLVTIAVDVSMEISTNVVEYMIEDGPMVEPTNAPLTVTGTGPYTRWSCAPERLPLTASTAPSAGFVTLVHSIPGATWISVGAVAAV